MSQAQAAADRLPWLPDEPNPPKRRESSSRAVAGWATAAVLVVAGASYWMGAHSWQAPSLTSHASRSSDTVRLPQPGLIESQPQVGAQQQPQVNFDPAPQVTPAPEREVRIARPRVDTRAGPAIAAPRASREPAEAPADVKPAPAAPLPAPAPQAAPGAAYQPLAVWPATQSQGAYGRIVRIGAFGTRLQAKLGWRYMVQSYPAVAHLQAAVVETRNSRGRQFYRFQIGTTSQAHSEVLCQRMEKIRLSCAVVGLPWKPTGVER